MFVYFNPQKPLLSTCPFPLHFDRPMYHAHIRHTSICTFINIKIYTWIQFGPNKMFNFINTTIHLTFFILISSHLMESGIGGHFPLCLIQDYKVINSDLCSLLHVYHEISHCMSQSISMECYQLNREISLMTFPILIINHLVSYSV